LGVDGLGLIYFGQRFGKLFFDPGGGPLRGIDVCDLGKLLAEDLACFVHLFYFFTPLGFRSFQNDDSTEQAIPNVFLALEELLATCAEFFKLALAMLQVLLLSLELDQLVLPLLELRA